VSDDQRRDERTKDEGTLVAGEVPPRSRGAAVARASHSPVVRRVQLPSQAFVHTEAIAGLTLIGAALLALLWANSPFAPAYEALWSTRASLAVGAWQIDYDLRHWVNDGLMTLFFLAVGLELRREAAFGGLNDMRRAALPVAAAVGGMAVPALVYLAIAGSDAPRGWGIPVATDIAFALGVLALVGRRLPATVRMLLLSIAAADDVGGILVIALVYSETIAPAALGAAAAVLAACYALRAGGVRHVVAYAGLAILLWLAVHASGVHPTLAGVVLGLLAPVRGDVAPRQFAGASERILTRYRAARRRHDDPVATATLGQLETLTIGTEAPVDRLLRLVQPWVHFGVLPLFAIANAGVVVDADAVSRAVASPVTLGIVAGLVVGKPVGIGVASWLAVRAGVARLPEDLAWRHVVGLGLLAGVGFTVSIFIGNLAFPGGDRTSEATIGVLAASVVAGLLGFLALRLAERHADT
jgi:NhaA family Na+:H+ antiporter